jgi:hypothetical protein
MMQLRNKSLAACILLKTKEPLRDKARRDAASDCFSLNCVATWGFVAAVP